MGEKQVFQPLTREDKITATLYRIGIVLSTLIVLALAYYVLNPSPTNPLFTDILGYCLYASVGMSVFFIHLYIGKFKTFLKNLYYVSLACLVFLLILGKGSLSGAFLTEPLSVLLLLPLSGCLGFITAKEAFCFKLLEGYLLAMIMPAYLLLVAVGILAGRSAAYGLIVIAAMLALFALRKTPMPLAWDIGDKSAYR